MAEILVGIRARNVRSPGDLTDADPGQNYLRAHYHGVDPGFFGQRRAC
jgi:hypothetical protein